MDYSLIGDVANWGPALLEIGPIAVACALMLVADRAARWLLRFIFSR